MTKKILKNPQNRETQTRSVKYTCFRWPKIFAIKCSMRSINGTPDKSNFRKVESFLPFPLICFT